MKFIPLTKVDNQGRLVLPKEVREALRIKGGCELICRVVGRKIILERFSIEEIRKTFEELEKIAPGLDLDTVEVSGGDKYIDREYALRKIGFRGHS